MATRSHDTVIDTKAGKHSARPKNETSAKQEALGKSKALSPRDRVIKDIVRGVYAGKFKAGQRLTEAQLTEVYGISRGPVREALNRLAAMGVVELMPQRGAQIRVLGLDEAIDSLVVAQGLVGIAARLAAERECKDGGKERLKAAVAELMQFDQTSSTAEYALARDSFYSALTRLADNAALSSVMTQLHIHVIRVQFRSVLRKIDRRRHQDYIGITEAVLAGDASRAERLARAHLGKSVAALKAHKAREEAA